CARHYGITYDWYFDVW
nr:immunoglobulin heavy chain junction region [Mus musculus]